MTAPITFPTVEGQRLDPDPILAAGPTSPSVFRIQLPYGGPAWLVTRHADVKAMLTDTRFSRAATVEADVARTQPYPQRANTIIGMDPPDHSRVRRLVTKAFTVRRVEELRPRTREIVDELIDGLEVAASTGSPAELVEGLAVPLPIAVISELLGVPFEDRLMFRGWADAFMSSSGYSIDQIMEAHGHIERYLAGMIEQRRAAPTPDLLGALVHERDDNDRLSEAELAGLSLALLVGGYETTASQLAKFVYCLLAQPEQWARLVTDPSLVPSAVEELMRFVNLAAGTSIAYVATEELVLDGVAISEGDAVIASLAAANRDPEAFEAPLDLDVARAENPHVGFGHGIHFCLGAALARMELQEAIDALVRRHPGLRLAVPADQIEWKTRSAVWGLAALPVVF